MSRQVDPSVGTTCSRCQRVDRLPFSELQFYNDDGTVDLSATWTGSESEPVCPHCQLAEWHPCCTTVRADCGYGERVDLEALSRGEQVTVIVDDVPVIVRSSEELEELEPEQLGLGWCHYIDPSVVWMGDGEAPSEWRCPKCGGDDFEWVHLEYPKKSRHEAKSVFGDVEKPDDE